MFFSTFNFYFIFNFFPKFWNFCCLAILWVAWVRDNPCAQPRQVDYYFFLKMYLLYYKFSYVVNLPCLCARVVQHCPEAVQTQANKFTFFYCLRQLYILSEANHFLPETLKAFAWGIKIICLKHMSFACDTFFCLRFFNHCVRYHILLSQTNVFSWDN